MVKTLYPLQTSERSQFWNGLSYGINKYAIEVLFNGITCLRTFMKIHQSVQK